MLRGEWKEREWKGWPGESEKGKERRQFNETLALKSESKERDEIRIEFEREKKLIH